MNEDKELPFESQEELDSLVESVKPSTETVEFATTEGKVVDSQEVEIPEDDAATMAAGVFARKYPLWADSVDKLSGKSARRVLKALVGVPLVDPKFNSKNELEKAVYLLGERLLEAKMVVALQTLYEYNQELQKATDTNTVQETVNTEGVQNG